jgi:hypothetical protein
MQHRLIQCTAYQGINKVVRHETQGKPSRSKETWERKGRVFLPPIAILAPNPIKNKQTPKTGMVKFSASADSPEFFKVFLPYTSSHQIVIFLSFSLLFFLMVWWV